MAKIDYSNIPQGLKLIKNSLDETNDILSSQVNNKGKSNREAKVNYLREQEEINKKLYESLHIIENKLVKESDYEKAQKKYNDQMKELAFEAYVKFGKMYEQNQDYQKNLGELLKQQRVELNTLRQEEYKAKRDAGRLDNRYAVHSKTGDKKREYEDALMDLQKEALEKIGENYQQSEEYQKALFNMNREFKNEMKEARKEDFAENHKTIQFLSDTVKSGFESNTKSLQGMLGGFNMLLGPLNSFFGSGFMKGLFGSVKAGIAAKRKPSEHDVMKMGSQGVGFLYLANKLTSKGIASSTAGLIEGPRTNSFANQVLEFVGNNSGSTISGARTGRFAREIKKMNPKAADMLQLGGIGAVALYLGNIINPKDGNSGNATANRLGKLFGDKKGGLKELFNLKDLKGISGKLLSIGALKAGGIGGIVLGSILAIVDGVKFMLTGGKDISKIGKFIGGFFGGEGQGGVKNAFKTGGRWALTGAGIGLLVGGPIGALIGGAIGAVFGGVLGAFGAEKIGKVVDKLGAWFKKTWNDMLEGIKKLPSILKNWFGDVGAWFQTQFGKIGEWFGDVKVWISDYVVSPTKNFFISLGGKIDSAFNTAKDFVTEYIVNPVKNFFIKIGNAIGNIWDNMRLYLAKIPLIGKWFDNDAATAQLDKQRTEYKEIISGTVKNDHYSYYDSDSNTHYLQDATKSELEKIKKRGYEIVSTDNGLTGIRKVNDAVIPASGGEQYLVQDGLVTELNPNDNVVATTNPVGEEQIADAGKIDIKDSALKMGGKILGNLGAKYKNTVYIPGVGKVKLNTSASVKNGLKSTASTYIPGIGKVNLGGGWNKKNGWFANGNVKNKNDLTGTTTLKADTRNGGKASINNKNDLLGVKTNGTINVDKNGISGKGTAGISKSVDIPWVEGLSVFGNTKATGNFSYKYPSLTESQVAQANQVGMNKEQLLQQANMEAQERNQTAALIQELKQPDYTPEITEAVGLLKEISNNSSNASSNRDDLMGVLNGTV